MMTAFITNCVTLTFILTQTSCYTFVSPKVFGQPMSPALTWPEIFQYPMRSYHPSIPLQVLHYYGNAYYPRNLQNRNYYFPQDSYDDSDYFSNFLYYYPPGRAAVNPIEELPELPDYEDDAVEDDTVPKSQRDWWLEKDVAANEDTDPALLNRVDSSYGSKSTVSKTQSGPILKSSRQFSSKSRYDGIDGFGRKKGPEDVTYRPTTPRKEERTSVYGKPARHDRNEDSNLRDLKSLLRGPLSMVDKPNSADFTLRRWESGEEKRSGVNSHPEPKTKENSAYASEKEYTKVKPSSAVPYTVYDEGGREIVPGNRVDEIKWKEYVPEQTSVFDTIKTLLALEDEVNESNQDGNGKMHRLLKRKPPAYKPPVKNKSSNKDRSRNQASTTEVTPTAKTADESPSPAQTSPVKRTAGAETPADGSKSKSYHTSEDTLVRELSAARRQNS